MYTLTKEMFIKNAIQKHGTIYDYSNVHYTNAHAFIKIICSEHGEFSQTANSHLNGCGCPKCGIWKSANKKRKSLTHFINKANKIHKNRYDYSKVIYKNTDTDITIICPTHGEFIQRPDHHLRGSGCGKCAGVQLLTLNEFKEKATKIHANKYDYSLSVYVNGKTKITIICPKHGKFSQSASHHLMGQGCPNCDESLGEKKVINYLLEKNIQFQREHSFTDCIFKMPLTFDFYIPSHNLCIEFDGIQHFKPIPYFGGEKSLQDTKRKDKIKNDYCQKNNIALIRIRYNENVENKLNKLLPLYVR